jgi:1-acyl-sn-glycerol-3-phosphate acyltransferase
LFGTYLRKFGMIPVDRKGGPAALRAMAALAREAVDHGRQVLIFPEGTRREPGAAPAYKFGVAKMYAEIGRPVTPMVLNSGMYWSSYLWRGHPGTIIVEFLPPIPAGLPADAFFDELTRVMEAASDRILLETARRPDAPPLGASAQARVAALEAQGAAPVEAS